MTFVSLNLFELTDVEFSASLYCTYCVTGSSASGSNHSQTGGGSGRSSSSGSCHKGSLICADSDITEHCSLIGTHQYSLNGRSMRHDEAPTSAAVPQLVSSQHAPSSNVSTPSGLVWSLWLCVGFCSNGRQSTHPLVSSSELVRV